MTLYTYNLIKDRRIVDKVTDATILSPVAIGETLDVYLNGTMREKLDYINPVFLLQVAPAKITACNYLYCSELNRYYFVNNKVAVNDKLYEFHCHEDVLNTYRTQLKGSRGYVTRRQSNNRPYIVDTQRPVYGRPTRSIVYDDTAGHDYFDPSVNAGNTKYSFVVTVATPPGIGGSKTYSSTDLEVFPGIAYSPHDTNTKSYAFTHDGLADFFDKFYVEDFTSFMNAMWGISSDGIVSCVSLPFDLDPLGLYTAGGPVTVTVMGKTLTTTAPKLMANPYHKFTFKLFTNSAVSFLDYEPYTRATLYLPYVGMVEVPMMYLNQMGLYVDYIVDILTGKAQVIVRTTAEYVKTLTADVGIKIPITQTNAEEYSRNNSFSALSLASNIGMSIAGIFDPSITKNMLAMPLAGQKTTTSLPDPNMARFLRYRPYMVLEQTQAVPIATADYGRYIGYPYEDVVDLSTLTGEFAIITQIYNDSQFTSILGEEMDEIEKLLANGVFF